MAGLIDIFRLAMGHLDDRPIMDPGEKSLQAKLCLQAYPQSRDYLLRRAQWTFAARRIELPSQGAPAFGWVYKSQLPSNYLRVNWIASSPERNAPQIKYEVEGRDLLTDVSPVYLKYGRRVENTGEFDPMFVQALGAHIAMTIGGALGVPSTRIQQAAQAYTAFVDEAEMVDSTQSDEEPVDEGSWLKARTAPSPHNPRLSRF